MSLLQSEPGLRNREITGFNRASSLLSRLSLKKTAQLPPELALIVRTIDTLPEVDLDRGLRMMVDHDLWPQEIREHPEALPQEYAAKIANVAFKVVSREPEELTVQAFAALGRASDDTGNHDLLELAYEKATAIPRDHQIDPTTDALNYAHEHKMPFRESLAIIKSTKPQRDIAMKVRPSGAAVEASSKGHVHVPLPPEERGNYDFLYDPKSKIKINRNMDVPVPMNSDGAEISIEAHKKHS